MRMSIKIDIGMMLIDIFFISSKPLSPCEKWMRLSKTVNLWYLGKSNVSLFPLTHKSYLNH